MEINQRIHDKMVANVLHTKLKFFEQNTQGMILNRFSKDVQTLDKIVFTFLEVTDVSFLLSLTPRLCVVHSEVHDYCDNSDRHMPLGPNNRTHESLRADKSEEDKLALHEGPIRAESRADVPCELTDSGYTEWFDYNQSFSEGATLLEPDIQA